MGKNKATTWTIFESKLSVSVKRRLRTTICKPRGKKRTEDKM